MPGGDRSRRGAEEEAVAPLAAIKRFVNETVPGVEIYSFAMERRFGFMGFAQHRGGSDGGPCLGYDSKLRGRERALTILHELAHLLFDGDAPRGAATSERHRWREDRADRWAERALALIGGVA